MSWLSEESLLLAKNWDTVEAIFEAEQRLRRELTSILHTVEQELSKREWWKDGWVFVRHQDSQVYVSQVKWQVGDVYTVWIGVEGFAPRAIFGMESPPMLYVWVARKEYELAQALAREIEKIEEEVLGELDHRATGYVVKHGVSKCLPEEVDGYAERVCHQIVEFFAHYAQVLWQLDGIIEDYLENRGAVSTADDLE
jgi:hypothetical protein